MNKISAIFSKNNLKPLASEVLTCYLKQCNEPPWTSYFIKVGLTNLFYLCNLTLLMLF